MAEVRFAGDRYVKMRFTVSAAGRCRRVYVLRLLSARYGSGEGRAVSIVRSVQVGQQFGLKKCRKSLPGVVRVAGLSSQIRCCPSRNLVS